MQETSLVMIIKAATLKRDRMYGRCLCPSRDNHGLEGLWKEKETNKIPTAPGGFKSAFVGIHGSQFAV